MDGRSKRILAELMTQSWGQKIWRFSNKEFLELCVIVSLDGGYKRVGGQKHQGRGENLGMATALPGEPLPCWVLTKGKWDSFKIS